MRKVALVVDDSMLIRYSLCRFFEEHGFAVESATNGAEALEVLKRVHPDVIVTDMQMQKMSGSELITALKDNPETAKVPIIVVAGKATGYSETEKRAMADMAVIPTEGRQKSSSRDGWCRPAPSGR